MMSRASDPQSVPQSSEGMYTAPTQQLTPVYDSVGDLRGLGPTANLAPLLSRLRACLAKPGSAQGGQRAFPRALVQAPGPGLVLRSASERIAMMQLHGLLGAPIGSRTSTRGPAQVNDVLSWTPPPVP